MTPPTDAPGLMSRRRFLHATAAGVLTAATVTARWTPARAAATGARRGPATASAPAAPTSEPDFSMLDDVIRAAMVRYGVPAVAVGVAPPRDEAWSLECFREKAFSRRIMPLMDIFDTWAFQGHLEGFLQGVNTRLLAGGIPHERRGGHADAMPLSLDLIGFTWTCARAQQRTGGMRWAHSD